MFGLFYFTKRRTTMGNFQNVSMGCGVIKYNDVDIGFLGEDATFECNFDIEEFKRGVPRKLYGTITKEFSAQIKAGFCEITADNLSMALGGLTINTVAGSEATVTMAAHTIVACPYAPGFNYVQLLRADGLAARTITNTPTSSVVIKNSGETVTYVEGTDYIVDYTNGWVIFLALAAGTVVHITFKHTPASSKRLDLGSSFSLDQTKTVEFIHTNPNTGKDISIKPGSQVRMERSASDSKREPSL